MSLKIGWFAGQSDCGGPLAEEICCIWDKHWNENTQNKMKKHLLVMGELFA